MRLEKMVLKICGRVSLRNAGDLDFTHMISIGDPDEELGVLRLPSIPAESHLCLRFRDRKSPDRKDAPIASDIRTLFQWLDAAGEIESLLVHCGAGMSCSPAVAVLAMCHLQPEVSPFSHMVRVESYTEFAHPWPNPLVVALGDRVMGRNGAIVSGIDKWRAAQNGNAAL